jgi:hypothetical protein
MRKAIAFLFLLIICSIAANGQIRSNKSGWIRITKSSNGDIIYMHTKQIKTKFKTVKVWIKSKPAFIGAAIKGGTKDSYPPPPEKETVTLYEFSCSREILRTHMEIEYEDRKVISSITRTTNWQYVIPDTVGETLLIRVCKKLTIPF